jgi:hypothetical protein
MSQTYIEARRITMENKRRAGEILTKYLDEFYHQYKNQDPSLGELFLVRLTDFDKQLVDVGNGTKLSRLRVLNLKVARHLKRADWDFSCPEMVRAYGLVEDYAQTFLKQFNKEIMYQGSFTPGVLN